MFVCFQVKNLLPYEVSLWSYLKYLFFPTAMCTVLQLTERLLLDHAQRLPESKVQYVECSCYHPSVSDPWTLLRAAGRVALALCTERWDLCALASSWFAELPPSLNLFMPLFSGSITVPLLQCCWVGRGMFEDRPIRQLGSSCPLWEGTNWPMGSWKSWKWFSVLTRWAVKKPGFCLDSCLCAAGRLPALVLWVLRYSAVWGWFSSRWSPRMLLVTRFLNNIQQCLWCAQSFLYTQKTH